MEFLLFFVAIFFFAYAIKERLAPSSFVWTGNMICSRCGYAWKSRRRTPPARCAGCSSVDIEPLHRNSSLTLGEFEWRKYEKNAAAQQRKSNPEPSSVTPSEPTAEEKLAVACRRIIAKTDENFCVICDENLLGNSKIDRCFDPQLPGRIFCSTQCLHQWEEMIVIFKGQQTYDIFSGIRHKVVPKCPHCGNVDRNRELQESQKTVDYFCWNCTKPFFVFK